jgi:hypothetical protein
MEEQSSYFCLVDPSSLSPISHSSVPSSYCLVPFSIGQLSFYPMPYAFVATDNGQLTTDQYVIEVPQR